MWILAEGEPFTAVNLEDVRHLTVVEVKADADYRLHVRGPGLDARLLVRFEDRDLAVRVARKMITSSGQVIGDLRDPNLVQQLLDA